MGRTTAGRRRGLEDNESSDRRDERDKRDGRHDMEKLKETGAQATCTTVPVQNNAQDVHDRRQVE